MPPVSDVLAAFQISQVKIQKARRRPASPPGRQRRVLCLTEAALPHLSHMLLQLLAMLRLESPRWDFRHHVMAISDAKAPKQQWDRLLDTEQPDALIAFRGGRVFADWCVARSLPTVFVGGDPGTTSIPAVGVDTIAPISAAVAEFVRHRHRHICMPAFGVFQPVEDRQREAFRAAFQLANLPFDASWHTPASAQKDPDVVVNTMTRIARVRMPTAFIVMTWVEFVTISSFLQSHGLRIPQDASVVLLGTSDSLEWFRPRLSYYDYPTRKVARTVRKWIDHGCPSEPTRVVVSGHLVHGDSIATVPV